MGHPRRKGLDLLAFAGLPRPFALLAAGSGAPHPAAPSPPPATWVLSAGGARGRDRFLSEPPCSFVLEMHAYTGRIWTR